MATWQCDFQLVPLEAVSRQDVAGDATGGVAFNWDADWWEESQPPADTDDRISSLLPAARSWSHGLQVWGVEDGNRFDMWRREGRVDAMIVRFDVRDVAAGVVDGVVGIAVHCNAAFLRYDGLRVPSDSAALTAAILTSAAARFVDDPEESLRRIALGGPPDA